MRLPQLAVGDGQLEDLLEAEEPQARPGQELRRRLLGQQPAEIPLGAIEAESALDPAATQDREAAQAFVGNDRPHLQQVLVGQLVPGCGPIERGGGLREGAHALAVDARPREEARGAHRARELARHLDQHVVDDLEPLGERQLDAGLLEHRTKRLGKVGFAHLDPHGSPLDIPHLREAHDGTERGSPIRRAVVQQLAHPQAVGHSAVTYRYLRPERRPLLLHHPLWHAHDGQLPDILARRQALEAFELKIDRLGHERCLSERGRPDDKPVPAASDGQWRGQRACARRDRAGPGSRHPLFCLDRLRATGNDAVGSRRISRPREAPTRPSPS